jgi:hypothetical protein
MYLSEGNTGIYIRKIRKRPKSHPMFCDSKLLGLVSCSSCRWRKVTSVLSFRFSGVSGSSSTRVKIR